MPRGTQLSQFEKGQIQAFKTANKSNRWIATEIGRSRAVIDNFVNDMDGYTKNHVGVWTPKINLRTKRRIWAAASQTTSGSRRIRDELELDVSHDIVWRAIRENSNFVQERMNKCPNLTDQHKIDRMQWAEQRILEKTDWDLVKI